DGKELGTQVSGLSLVEADVAVIFGVGRSDVVVFIEEALRSVGVRVDHDGGALNLLSFLADGVLCVDGNGKGEGKGEDSLVHGEQEFYTKRFLVESRASPPGGDAAHGAGVAGRDARRSTESLTRQ